MIFISMIAAMSPLVADLCRDELNVALSANMYARLEIIITRCPMEPDIQIMVQLELHPTV